MENIVLVHRKSNQNFSESFEKAAVWKTCLRKILFCTENDLPNYQGTFTADDQIYRGESALTLLLEILCGLHSPIVGETEVFGQFRNFVESRHLVQDDLFCGQRKWLQFILSEVKKTRAEFLVGLGSQSYGSLLRKYSKNHGTVSVCGSGHLAQEILPWLSQKKLLQVLSRNPATMQNLGDKYKYKNLELTAYNGSQVKGEALVIAAPLSDGTILELIENSNQDQSLIAVYDLRGEDNNLAALLSARFPHIKLMGLHQFFAEIEETKKETQTKIESIRKCLYKKALGFIERTEHRPLGWDDLCA